MSRYNKTTAPNASAPRKDFTKPSPTVIPKDILLDTLNNFVPIYHKIRAILLKCDYWDIYNDTDLFSIITKLGLTDSRHVLDTIRPLFKIGFGSKFPSKHPFIHPSTIKSIPKSITNPPALNSDGLAYSLLSENYIPITKKDMYLNNFSVDWEFIPGYANKRDDSQHNNQNVLHGRASMFERCFRPRVHSPLQAFVTAIFSYLCDECFIHYYASESISSSTTYRNCLCFATSPAIFLYVSLTQPDKGIPFLYKQKFQKIQRNQAYQKISSMLPCLMTSLLELSARTTLRAIDQNFECHLVNTYLHYAETSLFGCAMEYKSFVSDFDQYILSRTQLTRFKTGPNGSISGYEILKPSNDKLLSDHTQFTQLYSDVINFDSLNSLSDTDARSLICMTQLLSNIPMVIATAPVLSIKYSGQATPGSGSAKPLKTTKVVINGDITIPIEFDDMYPEINMLRNSILKNISKHPPVLDKLEAEYIDAATTNSAGLSKSDMDRIMEQSVAEWGSEAKMYASLSNMRLIDAISNISNVFTTREKFEYELYDKAKTIAIGSRMQISRRQRSIFVVPTVMTLGPFIILKTVEPYIKKSAHTASGKTSGDIRDANQVLNNTSYPCTMNYSSDISGMDTSTFMGALRIVESSVLAYLKQRRGENNKFFINNQDGISKHITLQTRTLDDTGTMGPIIQEEFSVLEYLVIVAMMQTCYDAKMMDGMFLKEAKASSTVFQSGRYDTGAQHTTLNQAVEEVTAEILKEEFALLSVTTRPAVLGDDGSNRISTLNQESLNIACARYQEVSGEIWKQIGYKLDPVKSEHSAEFLKLYAIAGALSPYHYRVPLYTSEKGENYSRPVFGKIDDFKSVLYQLSSRCPHPMTNYPLLVAGLATLGYVKVSTYHDNTTISKQLFLSRSNLMSKSSYTDIKVNKLRPTDIKLPTVTWTDYINHTHIIALFPGIWFCAPFLAVPMPMIKYSISDSPALFSSGGSCYSFRSPAVCRDLLRFLSTKRVSYFNTVSNMSLDQFKVFIEDSNNPQHTMLTRYVRTYGVNNLYLIMKAYPLDLIDKVDTSIDTNLLHLTGINHAYILWKKLKINRTHLPTSQYPNLQKYISNTDQFLDPSRRAAAYFSNNKLELNYSIRVPTTMVYYHRLSTRTKESIATVSEQVFIDETTYDLLSSTFSTIDPLLLSDLAYGDYHIISTPRPQQNLRSFDFFEMGYGSGVPPKSIQSILLNELGMPDIDALSHKAIKDSINKDVVVKGVQDNVLRESARIYARGGNDALELAFVAMGLNQKNAHDVRKLISINGAFIYTMPFTINPSQLYYFNVNLPTLFPTCFAPTNFSSTRLEWFIFLSSLFHSPELASTSNMIIMGPYLGRLTSGMT